MNFARSARGRLGGGNLLQFLSSLTIDNDSGIRIANISSLVILKLMRDFTYDRADIVALLIASDFKIDMRDFQLTKKQRNLLSNLVEVARFESKKDIREF